MTFISYARNFEDVLLWRALKHVKNGFYVDIGPNDQTVFSVTRAFYEHGWRGLNIEPDGASYARLALARPLDTNLNLAVGGQPEGASAAKIDDPARETLEARQGGQVLSPLVQARPLAWILDQHAPQTVHLMRVNVEHIERRLVQGSELALRRPWILVIHAPGPVSPGANEEARDVWLRDERYTHAYSDGFNRVFVADEHAELRKVFDAPANVFDDFSLATDVIESLHPERAAKRGAMIDGAAADRDGSGQKAGKKARDALSVAANAAGASQSEVLKARADALEAQMKMRTAEARAKAALQRAEAAESLANALRDSTSWRITAPVRALSIVPSKFVAKYRRVRATPPRLLANVIKRRMVLAATRVPGAREVARQLRTRYPTLWFRLRELLVSGTAGGGASMAAGRWKTGAAFDTVTRPVDGEWESSEIPATFLSTGTAGLDTDRLLRRVREVSASTAHAGRDAPSL
jgi:hypothetical protein